MLQTVKSPDITEAQAVQENGELEDAIYMAMDKLEALCRVQAQLEAGDDTVDLAGTTRAHYAMVVEEQLAGLRALLNAHFG